MKIINKPTGDIIAEIITNRNMTLEEAIECAGAFVEPEDEWSEDVEIDGALYWSLELDIVG